MKYTQRRTDGTVSNVLLPVEEIYTSRMCISRCTPAVHARLLRKEIQKKTGSQSERYIQRERALSKKEMAKEDEETREEVSSSRLCLLTGTTECIDDTHRFYLLRAFGL